MTWDVCHQTPPQTLGAMAGHTWSIDPKRLGFTLARYKFVSKMLHGKANVLEVGCGDGWATAIVAREVGTITAIDADEQLLANARERRIHNVVCFQHDITHGVRYRPDRVLCHFDAAYSLDVLEHVPQEMEPAFLGNICMAIGQHGTFICGMPSLESQPYASELSRAGHVNCKTEDQLRQTLQKYFRNVFLFGLNDETLHTGFGPMCHYRLAVCTGAKL
jgi:2-polyprenyl-3-methyl-5-hydroxy-6-metoxy-1,4-benzoquinol methylase